MKKILGLDIGTNSIGWALVEQDIEQRQGKILGMGSRIIPMSQEVLGKFNHGVSTSQTAERTSYRGMRRLRERFLLRRERLNRVLNLLDFLPQHYADSLDKYGKFIDNKEVKLAYYVNENGKHDFLFKKSYNEMLADFRKNQPQLLSIKPNGEERKIPYDWTIYYLRKKALSQKIEKEELAWLLLQFNQKRGYYQRGEDEENNNKLEEFYTLKVVDVQKGEKGKKEAEVWYNITLENGLIYRRTSQNDLSDWKDKKRDFIVTTELNDDGSVKTDKDGKVKRSLRSPKEDDWALLKKKTENDLIASHKTVGEYIYNTLLQIPDQKIKGKLVRTIERDFYKDELKKILKKQIEFQPELSTNEKLNECIRELYKNNEDRQRELNGKNFIKLFVDDIIFYQRPLRSQKSNIGNCTLEFKFHKINKKDESGNSIKNVFEQDKNGKDIVAKSYLKGIPKSNPYYQEFRVWQWLYNLRIYTIEDDIEVTSEFIKDATDLENLFNFLMSKKEVDNNDIIEFLIEKSNRAIIEQQIRELFPKLNDEKIKAKSKSELKKKVKELLPQYRWNYVFDKSKEKDKSKKYPCNATGYKIRRKLEQVAGVPEDFLSKEKECQLWHIIYSVIDKNEFEKALKKFAKKNNLDEDSFFENFKSFNPFKSEYGSFSEKAIRKLLPLMRLGKHWDENEVPESVKEKAKSIQERLNDIKDKQDIESIAYNDIPKQILKSFFKFKNSELKDFIQGLQLYQASYLVYGRHSGAEVSDRWEMSYEIQQYLYKFKQHSLRNPIVEQVITETLRVVKDIWEQEAEKNNIQPIMVFDEKKKREVKSYPNIFDEIHIELGREMKNTAEDRKSITENNTKNENANLRIQAILAGFEKSEYNVEGIHSFSPSQQEILEDGVINREIKIPEDIAKISKSAQPTSNEILRYKLWMEQKYRSPYTGKIIPLSKLFTPAYEIEHIIPRSRYFDDSLSNKVICEAEINLLKGNRLGLEFIKSEYGRKVQIGDKEVTVSTEENYKNFVKEHYKNNNKKRNNLLLEEIPYKMITRQLNDTRYISKFVSKLLSNIVRGETNDNGINSTNLIHVVGKITSTLKQDWGLNDKWNELILPRFIRMNQITSSTAFTAQNQEGHTIPAIPLELSKGFQFKRIDHRHHAMDALVIALTTRNHVNYLNNQTALGKKKSKDDKLKDRHDLRNLLCYKAKTDDNATNYQWRFYKPWKTLTQDVKNVLETSIVSFKQNLRVINKTTNYYQKYKDGKKQFVKQEKGDNWAIRKPLHEETLSGKVNLLQIKEKKLPAILKDDAINSIVDKKLKVKIKQLKNSGMDTKGIVLFFNEQQEQWANVDFNKISVYYHTNDTNDKCFATRKVLDTTFSAKKIEKITDSGIQKILLNYLQCKGDPELAFSPEGIEELNKNITIYNDGKMHKPIIKVRVYEKGSRFAVGTKGNKKDKYVQGAPNLFFAIYANDKGERSYATIPLNEVIERQKQCLPSCPATDESGNRLLFDLSPNDLVYIPTTEEQENPNTVDFENLSKEQVERVYKVVSFTGNRLYVIPINISKTIVDKNEYTQLNKIEFTDNRVSVKEVCLKLNINRLGQITGVIR